MSRKIDFLETMVITLTDFLTEIGDEMRNLLQTAPSIIKILGHA